jgi:hypothetical protein
MKPSSVISTPEPEKLNKGGSVEGLTRLRLHPARYMSEATWMIDHIDLAKRHWKKGV